MKLNIGVALFVACSVLLEPVSVALGRKNYLVYSSAQGIQKLVLNSVKGPVQFVSGTNAGYVKKIAYNVATNMIYWIDDHRPQRIMGAHLNGTRTTQLLISRHLRPYDIAVDPYGGQLYFTDTATNKIYVYSLRKNKTIGAIVSGAIKKPRSIVLYPEKGLMFWTATRATGSLIRMAFMNGKHKKTLVKTGLGKPVELAIDTQQEKLYWIDSKLKRIEYIKLKGMPEREKMCWSVKKRKLLTRLNRSSKPVGLAVYGNKLIWMDRYFKVIQTTNKNVNSRKNVVQKYVTKPRDILVISKTPNQGPTHPCKNHQCSHLCFGRINGVSNCACPRKMRLDLRDKRTCSKELKCSHSQFMCHGSKKCIAKAWRCDRSADCEDKSDEKDCPICNSRQFKCRTGGECVARTAVCNGLMECTDGSDEDGCKLVSCPSSVFTCTNGRCIPKQWVCDRRDDCGDNSDERRC